MSPSHLRPGSAFACGATNNPDVRAFQRDLRALGYLRSGVDDNFGPGTEQAIRALQYDLLHNDGRGTDGSARVALKSFNVRPGGGLRVSVATGAFEAGIAEAVWAIVSDGRVGKIPASDDSLGDDRRAVDAIGAIANQPAPTPFNVAIVRQESGGAHFHVPHDGDEDRFVIVGLDHNDANKDHITSRGNGIGQSTLFNHPPLLDPD